MNSEHLADSWIQDYLVHKIRLGAPGWYNIKTGLLESGPLDKLVQKLSYCDDSSVVNKVYHHFRNRTTIQRIVITLQQIIITFMEDSRLVRIADVL
jgi:hypothetical protein